MRAVQAASQARLSGGAPPHHPPTSEITRDQRIAQLLQSLALDTQPVLTQTVPTQPVLTEAPSFEAAYGSPITAESASSPPHSPQKAATPTPAARAAPTNSGTSMGPSELPSFQAVQPPQRWRAPAALESSLDVFLYAESLAGSEAEAAEIVSVVDGLDRRRQTRQASAPVRRPAQPQRSRVASADTGERRAPVIQSEPGTRPAPAAQVMPSAVPPPSAAPVPSALPIRCEGARREHGNGTRTGPGTGLKVAAQRASGATERCTKESGVGLSVEEERLRASLARLDAELDQKRATTAGSSGGSYGGGGYYSAPAASMSRVASRLRMAAAAAACEGFDVVPCKQHGLLACKLCAAAASRRPAAPKKKPAKQPPRLPPPPRSTEMPRRARSAGASSYAAMCAARHAPLALPSRPAPLPPRAPTTTIAPPPEPPFAPHAERAPQGVQPADGKAGAPPCVPPCLPAAPGGGATFATTGVSHLLVGPAGSGGWGCGCGSGDGWSDVWAGEPAPDRAIESAAPVNPVYTQHGHCGYAGPGLIAAAPNARALLLGLG